jgi:tyrosinase
MGANNLFSGMSRRQFLTTTAAAAVATSLPLRAQYVSPTAKYTRISLTDPGTPAMLDSYATAIKALLKLPPSDPRNFYRNAFIHTLDCPHGNWWFLPWHRGYLGWWEQTVRSLSGNPKFAFPYWDWTAQPFVPDAFWQGVLNPSASEFISSWSDFQTQLKPAMTAFYASLTPAQRTQLGARGLTTVNVLFAAAQNMFFSPSEARFLTQSDPNFDQATQQAVSLPTIQAALANTTFTGSDGGFGSDVATQHSQGVGYGILEGQPHNNVHGNVGGFMGNFLSTVDPIFMAHHANIDRLWWVWTAKQTAGGLPTLPTGPELAPWQQEPFLFFTNSQGQPVTQNTAGDYATIGQFNYTYTAGSGSIAAPSRAAAAPTVTAKKVTGSLKATDLSFAKAAIAEVTLPAPTLASMRGDSGPQLYARVAIQPPADPRGVRFHVLVNPPENALSLDFHHPSYAGTFEFFGKPHHANPITFTVALRDSVTRLRGANSLQTSKPLRIHVIPQTRGVTLRSLPKSSVTKIEVGSY